MLMIIGTLEVTLQIFNASSLKGKRKVVKGLKERIKHRFNVSISETDYHDVWQSAKIGVAIVASEQQFADSTLEKVINHMENCPDAHPAKKKKKADHLTVSRDSHTNSSV